MLSYMFLSALIIMFVSLIGVIFVWKGFGTFVAKNSHYLTTFAGGVFAVLAFAMVKETFHLSQSISIAIGSIVFGILLIELVTRIMPKAHHHHTLPPRCGKKHSCIDARRMMITDLFHNTGDGILLVGAYMIDIHVGIVATIGIFLHEIVQEISEFFIFKEAGYSTKRALVYNFLISSSILFGIALTLALSSIEWLIAPLMGFAAGGFIYVLSRDLIPHTIHNAKQTNKWLQYGIVFICGIGIMLFVNNIIPHSHEHDEHDKHIEHTDNAHTHEHEHDEHIEHTDNARM